jgi:spermidine synthase
MTQLALLRELLAAFSGNELVLGLGLGSWLLLTGVGVWTGRFWLRWRDAARALVLALLGLAVVPLLQVLAVRGWRDVMFTPGAAVGPAGIAAGCAVLLAPFCLASGGVLTLATGSLAREGDPWNAGRVYAADTLGSIAGGILFSFALAPWLDHFALLCVPALLMLGLAAALAHRAGFQWLRAAGILGAMVVTAMFAAGRIDDRSTQWQYRGRVVWRAGSPYGRLVVTDEAGQLTFYENGAPVVFTDNIGQNEESVLYALAERPAPRRVLLISGAVTGAAREAIRGGAGEVTAIELDPRFIEAGRRLLPENVADPRIKLVADDARRFVQRAAGEFDLIILALPDPSTLQLNRFFTSEFFAAARRALRPGGVLAFGLGRYENYIGPDLTDLLACTHRTLGGIFPHVLMVPGGRVYYLASETPLDPDITSRLEERGLAGRLVNRHYLLAMLAPDRLADLARAVASPGVVNTDFNPVLYFHLQRHWLSQFAFPVRAAGLTALLVCLVYFVRLQVLSRVIFASGFSAAVLEIVLLLAFQIFYGSLYQQLGLVVTVFMAGLAGGAVVANRRGNRWPRHRAVAGLAGAIAGLAALLPLLLSRLPGLDARLHTAFAGQAALLALALVLALLVGAQFSVAGRTMGDEAPGSAARLFTADLVGAALGAVLVSTVLIPLVGVTAVCLLTAGLNVVVAAPTVRLSARL